MTVSKYFCDNESLKYLHTVILHPLVITFHSFVAFVIYTNKTLHTSLCIQSLSLNTYCHFTFFYYHFSFIHFFSNLHVLTITLYTLSLCIQLLSLYIYYHFTFFHYYFAFMISLTDNSGHISLIMSPAIFWPDPHKPNPNFYLQVNIEHFLCWPQIDPLIFHCIFLLLHVLLSVSWLVRSL